MFEIDTIHFNYPFKLPQEAALQIGQRKGLINPDSTSIGGGGLGIIEEIV